MCHHAYAAVTFLMFTFSQKQGEAKNNKETRFPFLTFTNSYVLKWFRQSYYMQILNPSHFSTIWSWLATISIDYSFTCHRVEGQIDISKNTLFLFFGSMLCSYLGCKGLSRELEQGPCVQYSTESCNVKKQPCCCYTIYWEMFLFRSSLPHRMK